MSELALRLIEENKKNRDESLNLEYYDLVRLPEELSELSWLKRISLLGNEYLTDLSPLSTLKNLQEIRITSTNVSDLSPLNQLTELRVLDCSYTQVNDLSPIINLINIEKLNFANTLVKEIDSIRDLLNLKYLICFETKVSNLSNLDWSRFQKISYFQISNSNVNDISPLIPFIENGLDVKIDGGGNIDVSGCPLTNPPIEIVKQGNNAILNFFDEKERQGMVKGYEAKMIIIGEGGAGKTTLMRRLYQTDRPLPEENESTKGIDIHRYDFRMADGSDFRLNVWDFGGQEVYHATHQFFLTKRSLYVLLDDTRKDHKTVHDEGFKYWLEAVELLGGHSPVLIFQNEKSDRSKQIDIAGIKGKFDNVQGVWKGNLEYLGTADKLRDAIELFAKNLPHVGEELPAKWVSIRTELEELARTKPYVSQQEYFNVYGNHLEFDRTKALHLSQYLHDLGVFLHFQEDGLLVRTVILQNNWATEAVFRMLDDEMVKSKLGRFTEVDCRRVWADSTWTDMHPELLALMQKFELCYILPDAQPRTWLVPQLLPPSKPKELSDWVQPGDLVLRYRYEFLPKGLVSRLMVRQHRFVPRPEMAWTSGGLFEYEDSQLFVEIPPKGGEIALRARGNERKELLSVIAADLDALNETFHGLPERVSKLVPCNCKRCLTLAEPGFFEQRRLLQRKRDGKLKVECPSSYEEVDVLELLDGVSVRHLPGWARGGKDKPQVETIIEIRELIEMGETQKALDVFKKIALNEATILLGNFKELKTNHSQGLIKDEDFLREKAKINAGLLDLLGT